MSSAKRLRALAVLPLLAAANVGLAADLSSIVAVPQQGQSADRARRDRYECHNGSIEQTGTAPLTSPGPEVLEAERRARSLGRVLTSAGIGAVAGSVIGGTRDHGDAAEGALVGGMLGAIVGAVTGRNKQAPEAEAFNAYYQALSACLTARGYEVSIAAD